MSIKQLTVYCGSSPGNNAVYAESARALGRLLAQRGITLVYGGGRVGMMGQLADAALEAGARVTGVITRHLYNMEVGHTGTDLQIVDTMHERKARMAELGDGFVMLPGGLGSLDEFFEVLTWAQLGLHSKPCGLLNVYGYFEELMRFLEHVHQEQFMSPGARQLILHHSEPELLLDTMMAYSPVPSDKGRWARSLSQIEV